MGDDGALGLDTGKATAASDVKRDRILGFFRSRLRECHVRLTCRFCLTTCRYILPNQDLPMPVPLARPTRPLTSPSKQLHSQTNAMLLIVYRYSYLHHQHCFFRRFYDYYAVMTPRFSKGEYNAQVFAYERDSIRLLHEVQQYVAAGNALYGAVYVCRYSSGRPSVIEKQAITAASSSKKRLTLTLLHIDTTWRFDGFNNRLASPKLSWPAIPKFYAPGTYVEADLILRDQHPVSGGCPGPPDVYWSFRIWREQV